MEVKNAYKSYVNGEIRNEVLKNVSFQAEQGEFIAILGPSGSGKSTLLNMLGGLDKLDSGEIILDGKTFTEENDDILSQYRRQEIGFIFQSFNLIPVLSVYENIVLPVVLDDGKVDESYIDEILNQIGMKEKSNYLPTQLSGGQQQRVAIARALANKPQIILADEPTGNLDTQTGNDVIELLMKGVKKYGQTLILITHNENIARMADRVLYLKNGSFEEWRG